MSLTRFNADTQDAARDALKNLVPWMAEHGFTIQTAIGEMALNGSESRAVVHLLESLLTARADGSLADMSPKQVVGFDDVVSVVEEVIVLTINEIHLAGSSSAHAEASMIMLDAAERIRKGGIGRNFILRDRSGALVGRVQSGSQSSADLSVACPAPDNAPLIQLELRMCAVGSRSERDSKIADCIQGAAAKIPSAGADAGFFIREFDGEAHGAVVINHLVERDSGLDGTGASA